MPGQSTSAATRKLSALNPEDREEIFRRLAEPIPATMISEMELGSGSRKQDVDYIAWYHAVDLLDERAPDWQNEIVEVGEINSKVFICMRITICGVSRQNVGHEDSKTDSWGDPFSNAYAQAIKRTAMLFLKEGRAQLYGKGSAAGGRQSQSGKHDSKAAIPSDPIAKTAAGRVSEKQLVAIRAIANSQRVEAEAECRRLFNCDLEQLSRRAASYLIDHLKEGPSALEKERASGGGAAIHPPSPRTGSEDPVTDKQLAAIYSISKAKALDARLESLALFRVEPEKLLNSQAGELIEHLSNVRKPSSEDPENVTEWACSPDKRKRILDLRRTLKERHGQTEESLLTDASHNFAPGNIIAMSDEIASRYIAHLSEWLTSLARNQRA